MDETTTGIPVSPKNRSPSQYITLWLSRKEFRTLRLAMSPYQNVRSRVTSGEKAEYRASSINMNDHKVSYDTIMAIREFSMHNMVHKSAYITEEDRGVNAGLKNAFLVLYLVWYLKHHNHKKLEYFRVRNGEWLWWGLFFDYMMGLDVELECFTKQGEFLLRNKLQLKTYRRYAPAIINKHHTMKLFAMLNAMDDTEREEGNEPPLIISVREKGSTDSLCIFPVSGSDIVSDPVVDFVLYGRYDGRSWLPEDTGGSGLKDLLFTDMLCCAPLGRLLYRSEEAGVTTTDPETEISSTQYPYITRFEKFTQSIVYNRHGVSYLVDVPHSYLQDTRATLFLQDAKYINAFREDLRPGLVETLPLVHGFFYGNDMCYYDFFKR